MTAYAAPGHSNDNVTLLHTAEILTSLPTWLPMAIYRRVRGSHSQESQ